VTETTGKPRSRRRLRKVAIVGTTLLALFIGATWYLRSQAFEQVVRRRVIAYLEKATNGRVELGAFHWNVSRLEIDVRDLTIHGREAPDELPFAHVNRLYARLHIISLAEARVSLRELRVDRPVFHLVVYPDGRTNAPEIRANPQSNKTPIQQLLDLAIGRADFRRGLLLLNQRALPVDFGVNDVDVRMVYDSRAKRYDSKIDVGRLDVTYQDWRDVAAEASLELSLWQNAVEVKSLRLTSQRSSIEVNGKLTDFKNPRIQLTYDSNLDLAQLGAVVRSYNLRAGTLTLNGSGKYFDGDYSSTGRAAVRSLNYVDQGLDLRDVSLNSNFSAEREHLKFTRIAARFLGGEVTGDAEVKNYTSWNWTNGAKQAKPQAGVNNALAGRRSEPPHRSKDKTLNGQLEQGIAHLQLRDLSLAELARAFSTRSMPLANLKPVGSASGTADVVWAGSLGRANADLALEAVPPAHPASNELPIRATVRGRYSAATDVMTLSAANVSTLHTQLNGSGDLSSRSAALKLTVTTTSLAEFQPLLSALGNEAPPVQLAGQATFTGTVNGKLKAPEIAGHLQATDFNYSYIPPSPPVARPVSATTSTKTSFFHRAAAPPPQLASRPQPREIHIDSFAGDVQYSLSQVSVHRGVIHQGNTWIDLDGSATLQNGSFTDTTPFQIEAALHNGDAGTLQHVIGTDYPVSGTLNLTLQASGTEQNPHGQGQISLQSAEVYGRAVKALTSKVEFANHEAQLNDVHLQALNGTVQGAAAYNFSSKTARFDLKGESIDLAHIPELQSARFTTAGTVKFTAKGSGSLEVPDIVAHLEATDLVLNGEAEGGLVADAESHGAQLHVTARSRLPRASAALDGNVELHGDLPANLSLQFERLDIDPFLRAEIRGTITGHSAIAGQAHLTGPLRQPRHLNGTLKIDTFNVEVEKIALASDGPIELTLRDQVISAQRCALVAEDSRFTLAGSLDLKGDKLLDVRANGHVNVKLLQTFEPELISTGTTDVDVRIKGTVANPIMVGRITVSHIGLSMIDLPAGLSDLNGSLLLNQNRLEVEQLTGRTGGGKVTFTGFVSLGTTIGFDLGAQGNEIRFRYAGVSVTSDQRLHLVGTLQNSNLTGDITVTRFAQNPTADLTFILARNTPAEVPNPTSPLNNLHLDVRIVSAPELTVQTSLAKLSGDVDLRLRGTPVKPVLLGRVNIAEGDIKLNGTKYHLERGDVTFSDPIRIDPILDVEATTHVRDYDITIGLHGSIEKLNATYRSDPPLSSDDIIALLAFGRTQQESNMSASIPNMGFAQSASNAVLGQAINATVGNRVSKLFGVSSIRINPSVGGPENNPNARLTVEQQVSNNITLTYITNLSESAQQVIQFEYNINPQYSVVGMRDENGVVSFDLLVRKRKK